LSWKQKWAYYTLFGGCCQQTGKSANREMGRSADLLIR
jgi:hypothetical protein